MLRYFFLIGSFVSPLLVAVAVALFFKIQTMEGSPSQFYLSIRERVRKKNACALLKKKVTSLARTVTTMSPSKPVNDLTESIIHSRRRLINVLRFTAVQLSKWQGK